MDPWLLAMKSNSLTRNSSDPRELDLPAARVLYQLTGRFLGVLRADALSSNLTFI